MTTLGAEVSLRPVGDADIVFLAFSVIIVTKDSPKIELITILKDDLSPGTKPTIYINSSKFNFTGNESTTIDTCFYQWLTGKSGETSSSRINYWTYLSLRVGRPSSSRSSELKISFEQVDSKIYMTGVKIAVFLVSKVIDNSGVANFSTTSQDGAKMSRIFSQYLAVNTTFFG